MSAAKHIFVSYSRRDTESVDRIVEALRGAGYDVWIDRGGIAGARLWRREIVVAIRDSNAFLIALSPHSVASDNVRKELDLCSDYHRHIVPLILAETTIPEEMDYQLAGIQRVDCQSFDTGFQELCRALESLNVERLDPSTDSGAPAKPAASGWREELGAFGGAGALAAAAVYGASRFAQAKTAVPASLTPLMPDSLLDHGGAGLFSLGVLGILAALGLVFRSSRSLRPAIVGLAAFLLPAIPLALWKGQYIAASLGVIAAVAVGAGWSRWPKSGTARASIAPRTLVLLGSVILGIAAQLLLLREPGDRPIIGMTPFEVAGDEKLEREQVDLSNRLRLKLSAVFSRAGLKVVPQEGFKSQNLNDWSYDNWRVEKASQVEPRLLLKTTISRCGHPAPPGAPQSASYTWLVEPYGRDLEPLPDFASASGSDTGALSLRLAYKILTSTPSVTRLSNEQRNAAMKEILYDALTAARSRGMAAQIRSATSLLAQASPADQKVLDLLDSFSAADGACDEEAARHRNAEKEDASSYSEGG